MNSFQAPHRHVSASGQRPLGKRATGTIPVWFRPGVSTKIPRRRTPPDYSVADVKQCSTIPDSLSGAHLADAQQHRLKSRLAVMSLRRRNLAYLELVEGWQSLCPGVPRGARDAPWDGGQPGAKRRHPHVSQRHSWHDNRTPTPAIDPSSRVRHRTDPHPISLDFARDA